MGKLLCLESFDPDDSFDAATATPPQTFADGYAAGLAEAAEKFTSEQATLKQDLVQSISDAAFGYHEAQAHLITSIAPLFDAMVTAILPATLAPALHAHILDMVQSALKSDLQTPVILKVPADQCEAIAAIMGDANAPHVRIEADLALGNHAAWIIGAKEETALDLDGTLAAIMDHTSALFPKAEDRNTTKAS